VFGKTWQTSERTYGITAERGIRIRLRDRTELHADIFRPDAPGKFPAILGFHPYDLEAQSAPIRPRALAITAAGSLLPPDQEKGNGPIEAGDPNFYARRGYVHVIANVRGTGQSGGTARGEERDPGPPARLRRGCPRVAAVPRRGGYRGVSSNC